MTAYVVIALALIPCVWRAYPRRVAVTAVAPAPAAGGIGGLARTVSFWALVLTAAIGPAVGYLAAVLHALQFVSLGYSAWEASIMLMIGGVLSTRGRAFAGQYDLPMRGRAGPIGPPASRRTANEHARLS